MDWIYVATVGSMLGLAGGRARRLSWLASGLIALWMTPQTAGRLVAIAALGIAIWGALTIRRRWAGALIGALLAWVLGDLGAGPFHGATTVYAALAALPMVVSAAVRLPTGRLRVVGAVVSTAGAMAILATMVFGLAGLLATGDVSNGIEHAQAAFDEASQGNEDLAADEFEASGAAFDQARDKIGGFWTLPARLVPVVGQHVRAVQVVASEGVSLADTAAETTRAVDPDAARLVGGGLDLDFIDELAPVLARAELAIDRARERIGEVEDPWLIDAVASRLDELMAELDAAAPAAETAALAAAEVPGMLGAGGPVDWLVLMTTPAEARGLGGLVGNWVLVRADDGRLEIADAGRNEDLNRVLRDVEAELRGPQQYIDRWGTYTPEVFFQDVTLAPDLPSVAAVAADLYEQATASAVDGVITLDPFAVAALLDIAGPVQVGDTRLTSDSVVDFLLVGQYTEYEDDELGRVAALSALVAATFDVFTGGDLPGPRGLAATIGPVIDADRLGVWWAAGGDPARLIDSAGLDGAFPGSDSDDLFALVHQNSGQNKIDVYLERSISYEIEVDGGRADAHARIELFNRAPESGLPLTVIGSNDQGLPPGTNAALVSVHTALDVVQVRVDGEPVPIRRAAAFGNEAATFEVEIGSGETVVIDVELVGTLPTDGRPGYRLALPNQPLVDDDTVSVVVTIDGKRHELLREHRLVEDIVVDTG